MTNYEQFKVGNVEVGTYVKMKIDSADIVTRVTEIEDKPDMEYFNFKVAARKDMLFNDEEIIEIMPKDYEDPKRRESLAEKARMSLELKKLEIKKEPVEEVKTVEINPDIFGAVASYLKTYQKKQSDSIDADAKKCIELLSELKPDVSKEERTDILVNVITILNEKIYKECLI